MVTDKKRLQVFLAFDVLDDISMLGKKIGMSKNKVAQLAITAGMASIKLAINPDWSNALEVLGKDLDEVGVKRFITGK
jgi:hypothetical protein